MNIRQIPHGARRLTLAAVIGAGVVGSFALAPTATAQGQEPQQQGSPDGARMDPRQMIDQKMAKLTETLKLDSAQQTKVRSILSDETMEMEDLRKNSGGQRAGGGGGGAAVEGDMEGVVGWWNARWKGRWAPRRCASRQHRRRRRPRFGRTTGGGARH